MSKIQDAKELSEKSGDFIAITMDEKFIKYVSSYEDHPPIKYIVDSFGYYYQENDRILFWIWTPHEKA